MSNIRISYEAKRGCGYRKGGGLYLVSGSLGDPCGRLPIPLTVCPCCHQGIKVTRGFTWVSGQLIKDSACQTDGCTGTCSPAYQQERYGLLWIGEKFYKTPREFANEALLQGISRRISAVPKDFKIGETWILLAHRKAIEVDTPIDLGDEPIEYEKTYIPAIFRIFLPEKIEYVVKGTETEEELEALEKRGLSLVKIIPVPDNYSTEQL